MTFKFPSNAETPPAFYPVSSKSCDFYKFTYFASTSCKFSTAPQIILSIWLYFNHELAVTWLNTIFCKRMQNDFFQKICLIIDEFSTISDRHDLVNGVQALPELWVLLFRNISLFLHQRRTFWPLPFLHFSTGHKMKRSRSSWKRIASPSAKRSTFSKTPTTPTSPGAQQPPMSSVRDPPKRRRSEAKTVTEQKSRHRAAVAVAAAAAVTAVTTATVAATAARVKDRTTVTALLCRTISLALRPTLCNASSRRKRFQRMRSLRPLLSWKSLRKLWMCFLAFQVRLCSICKSIGPVAEPFVN